MNWNKVSEKVTEVSGSSYTFLAAVLLIIGWAVSGPFLHFSDTWQLIINTFTTLVTFLMVFLIQNAQNREQANQARTLKRDLAHTKKVLQLLTTLEKRSRQ